MHLTRREFLQQGTAASACFFFAATPQRVAASQVSRPCGNDHVLVLLQLSGGNDGLSTVVPHADPAYAHLRRRTHLDEHELLPLNEHLSLHKNLAGLHQAFVEGQLALILGAGYPHAQRSHFKSMDIWQAADLAGRKRGVGWVSRFVDAAFASSRDPNLVVHVGQRVPFALLGGRHKPVAFATPGAYRWTGSRPDQATLDAALEPARPDDEQGFTGENTMLARMRDALRSARASSDLVRQAQRSFRPRASFPKTALGGKLATVAALLSGGLGTRVYSLAMGGFDTHVNQKPRHDRLMSELGQALTAFQKELAGRGLDRRVCVLAFSEFGRRVAENGSGGTDHGLAGPMLLLGAGVKGGLHGQQPGLAALDHGDLVHKVDFRRVYASVMDDWFLADQRPVLGQAWPTLPLFSES